MKLYIKTLGRVHKQHTLRFVPDATLVVQAHEADAYKAAWPTKDVLVLPESVKTIGATDRYLLEVAARREPDMKVVLLDDDLTFYRRIPDSTKLRLCNAHDMDILWNEVETQLDEYVHVAVSAREGNNRLDLPYEFNIRYMRVRAYNAMRLPDGLDIDRINCLGDFDVNLQLLAAGLPSCVLTEYAQNHPGTQAPGGCTTQRTNDTHKAETQKLADLWPGIVKLVQKENKGGGEFGHRQEVVVSWKKALKKQ